MTRTTPQATNARTSPLHPILAPDSIAIVGASADPTKRGYKAMVGLIQDGYAGRIYPINPKTPDILGIKTLPDLTALPLGVDLALICTPAASVPALIRACGARGVRGAVILASGFRESGAEGAALEEQTLAAARAGGVRLIGPNTSGLFNLHKRLNLLALDRVRPGHVGFISQSGNMLLSLVLEAEHNGYVGFSTYVGPGNQTDIGFNDYLQYLGEDPHTRVATLYVEGFRDGQRFLQVARAVTRNKPVVVYKSGSTAAGSEAARSHTGALAGSHAMTVDVLRQAGVTVVRQSDEILPVAEALADLPAARGRRVAVIADGGGQATIAADRLAEAGLELAPLGAATRTQLAALLMPQASTRNPVDVAGSSDANPALLADCLAVAAADPHVDALFLVGMFGGYARRFAEHLLGDEMRGAEAILELAARCDKPIVLYSLYAPVKPPALRRLHEAGLPVYASIEHAVCVLAALAERGEHLARTHTTAPPAATALPAMTAMIAAAQEAGRDLLEPEARSLLRAHGIALEEEIMVSEPAQLAAVAAHFGDRPLAMKIVSPHILHKSDAGGVRLDLRGEAALRTAFATIMASCRTYRPDAALHGVLVAPMAVKGVELIVGVVRDPIFGPVLMCGLGGVLVEVLEDVAFRSLPIDRDDAESMLAQLRGRALLDGVRGAAPVDRTALVDLLLKVSALVGAYPQISELDLNPVIAHAGGVALVDARILLESRGGAAS